MTMTTLLSVMDPHTAKALWRLTNDTVVVVIRMPVPSVGPLA